MTFTINLYGHYKHNSTETRVAGIVKIGWISVIFGQFPKNVGRLNIAKNMVITTLYLMMEASYHKLAQIWRFTNKDKR